MDFAGRQPHPALVEPLATRGHSDLARPDGHPGRLPGRQPRKRGRHLRWGCRGELECLAERRVRATERPHGHPGEDSTMRLNRYTDVYDAAGPVLTATLDVSRDNENGEVEVAARWRELRAQLADMG